MSSALYQIDKLDDNNYEVWRIRMKSVLEHSELWSVTSGEITEPLPLTSNYEAWDKRNRKALATIILTVSTSQLNYVKNCTKASDAWNKLEEIYKSKAPIKKVSLYKQLCNFKMAEGMNMLQHINTYISLLEKINDADMKINDEMQVIILLSSLPNEYENFVIAMETRDNLPKLDHLKNKLLAEDDRRNQADNSNVNCQQAFFVRSNNGKVGKQFSNANNFNNNNVHNNRSNMDKLKCFNCGKRGHFAKNCSAPKRQKEHRKQERSFALIAATNVSGLCKASWCVDSGATSHICCDKNMFKCLSYTKEKVLLACDKFVESAGIGEVELITRHMKIILKDVLYVPDMVGNFISVAKAAKNGFIVKFEENSALICDVDGSIILKAQKSANLYTFKNEINLLAYSSSSNILRWHYRYGHLNFKNLSELSKKQIVNGLELNGSINDINCKTCLRSKICSQPFPSTSESKSKNILDLVHTDICGPMRKTSIGGSRYFMTFIDDKSRKIIVYFLKTKGEAFEKFKIFKNYVECQTERKIKALRSDNGKEYVNNTFNKFLEECGIKRQLTVPHTPQQNGVAERANRTIVEMARSMIIHAGVSEELWAEAVNTAVYIRNRALTKFLGDKTPCETWSGKVPNVQHLKIFGSPAIALDKTKKCKFAAKGKEYIFVGYSLTAKAYRLYDQVNRKVVEKRDVKFEENALINNYSYDNVVMFEEEEEETEAEQGDVSNDDKGTAEETKDEEENVNVAEEKIIGNETHIGRGRPRLIRNGMPGRPKKQYNILSLIKEQSNIYDIAIPHDFAEAMSGRQGEEWKKSMDKEYQTLVQNGTWTLVDLPLGKKAINCKWVYTVKRNAKGELEKFKSRLVAKGCSQRYGIDYQETFSPVVRHATIRLLLALACEYELYLHQMDVTSAYINSELHDEVYIKQPEGYEDPNYPHKVLKLHKALYGLKQSGREWNLHIDKKLKNMGFKPCVSEPCVYTRNSEGKLSIITIYVDDLIIGSSDLNELTAIKVEIADGLNVTDGGELHYFLGLEIRRENGNGPISMGHRRYIDEILAEYGMQNCKTAATPLNPGFQWYCQNENCRKVDVTGYQSLIGTLMYLALTSRPDILHAVCVLSQCVTDPHSEHEAGAKHVLRYLKTTKDFKIYYKKTGIPMQCYADADWAGDNSDRKSYTGCTVIAAGGAIYWESKKQRIVALSSTEAEYVALSTAAKEVVFIQKLLNEIGLPLTKPIVLNGDNQSAQHLVKNPVFHARSKHIDIKYHFVRELYKSGQIALNYVSTEEMIADILTKNLSKAKHRKFTQRMGLL